jgi:hypothetical protein
MSIVATLKRLVPKTPKQWVVAGLGTAAAALTVDYAVRRDGSIVAGLVHKLHGGGHGGGHPQHGGGGGAHAAPHAQMAQQQMYVPQYAEPPMVYVEPTMASNFNYRFQHHGSEHHPHAHHAPSYMPHQPLDMHPHHFAQEHHAAHHEAQHAPPLVPPSHPAHPRHQQHQHPAPQHHDTWLYEGGTTNPYDPSAQHPAHVAGADIAPHAPKQSRANIPPPGAHGVAVDHTPQAAGVVMGEFTAYGWEG